MFIQVNLPKHVAVQPVAIFVADNRVVAAKPPVPRAQIKPVQDDNLLFEAALKQSVQAKKNADVLTAASAKDAFHALFANL